MNCSFSASTSAVSMASGGRLHTVLVGARAMRSLHDRNSTRWQADGADIGHVEGWGPPRHHDALQSAFADEQPRCNAACTRDSSVRHAFPCATTP